MCKHFPYFILEYITRIPSCMLCALKLKCAMFCKFAKKKNNIVAKGVWAITACALLTVGRLF